MESEVEEEWRRRRKPSKVVREKSSSVLFENNARTQGTWLSGKCWLLLSLHLHRHAPPITSPSVNSSRFLLSPPILFFSFFDRSSFSRPLSLFSLSLSLRRYLIDTVSLVLSSPGTPAYLSAYKDGSLQRYMNCIVENGNLVEYIYIYVYSYTEYWEILRMHEKRF